MSGICAFWSQDPRRGSGAFHAITGGLRLTDAEEVQRAAETCAGVAVCSAFATQQLYQDEQVLIACDADLYNEAELRKQVDQGPADVPLSTAGLLGKLYLQLGSAFVERLRGAFSIVIWDRLRRQMVAAIDPFGIKRLAYSRPRGMFLIGTRVDALARASEVDTESNGRAIADLVNFSSTLAPETVFRGIFRLLPGSILTFSDGEVNSRKYWAMRYGEAGKINEAALARELESVVAKAVARQCKDDSFATLGAFLSGGTDSSTVVGLMSRLERGPVNSFSIGFEEQPFNELGYAKLAAERFKARHHTYLVGARECFAELPAIVRSFDEPYGNSSAVATYFCARLAAQQGVRTLLAGDGGDELFGGNERYATDKIFSIYQKVPLAGRRLLEAAVKLIPFGEGLPGVPRRYIRRANLPPVERYFSYHFLSAHAVGEVFEESMAADLRRYSPLDVPAAYYAEAEASDHLDRLLHIDVNITLADNDLPKVTHMCELAGIAARFPFLDREVAEFSCRIPASLKVKGFEKRYLFKRAFRNLLPSEIIRKKKHGFGIPVADWLKSYAPFRELSRDVLFSRASLERGLFRRAFLEDLFRKHEADDTTYYGDTLWTFLACELWHQQCRVEAAPVPA